MAGFFLLVENRRLPSARSPFFLGTLLHLLYESALPNKRLKLAGGDRLKGTGVLCPWRARSVVHLSCAGARVARSSTALSQAAPTGVVPMTDTRLLSLPTPPRTAVAIPRGRPPSLRDTRPPP